MYIVEVVVEVVVVVVVVEVAVEVVVLATTRPRVKHKINPETTEMRMYFLYCRLHFWLNLLNEFFVFILNLI